MGFKFAGLPIDHAGVNVSAEAQYQTFTHILQKSLDPRGGDGRISTKFVTDPFGADVPAEWNSWSDSALLRPDVMGLSVTPLWEPLREFTDSKNRAVATKIEHNWNWFAKCRQFHHTVVEFVIEAGWGSIQLLTDGVFEDIVDSATGETWHRDTSWLQWTAAPNDPKGILK